MNDSLLISIVTPAFNEGANLPLFYERLCQVFAKHGLDWEWIIVDDHSPDQTPLVIAQLVERDQRVRGIRLARNFGAQKASACGLKHSVGDCSIVMASDLQDPPECIPDLIKKWHDGSKVVWAVRREREGHTGLALAFSQTYYFIVRRFIGVQNVPASGADFFLLDKAIVGALGQFPEKTSNLPLLIAWMGFPQGFIEYDKQMRAHGKSGWSFSKKVNLMVDTIVAFTSTPLRCMTYLGILCSFLGFLYLSVLARNYLVGDPVEGWTSLMSLILMVSGLQMGMFGVLGEYVWRSLEEARKRPNYLIERVFGTVRKGSISENLETSRIRARV